MAMAIHTRIALFENQKRLNHWTVEDLKNIIRSGLTFELSHEENDELDERLNELREMFVCPYVDIGLLEFVFAEINQLVALNEEQVRVEAAKIILKHSQQKLQRKLEKEEEIKYRRERRLFYREELA